MKSFFQKTTWSSDDVRDARWKHGGHAMGSDTLHWYFLFPKGAHNDDSVLGVAVDASTVAVFQDTSDSVNFLGRPSADEIERAVTVHEAGHLLGLVNLVYQSPIDHEDPDHPGHSNNEDSVRTGQLKAVALGTYSQVVFLMNLMLMINQI